MLELLAVASLSSVETSLINQAIRVIVKLLEGHRSGQR